MAVGESAGSVYVIIDGDVAPLVAKYAQAETASRAAGVSVAKSFNVAANAADQTEASISDLIQVIREEGAAASLAAQRNAAMAGGFRQIGEGAHGAGINLRYALFAVKDFAEGRTQFALAEVVNNLVRFGPAALAGGAAIAALAGAFYGPIAAAKELQKEIDKTNKEIDEGLEKSLGSMERISVQMQTLQFGGAAGKRLEGFYDDQAYHRDLDKVHGISIEVDELIRQTSKFKITDIVPYFGSKVRAGDQKEIVDKQAEQQKLLEDADVKRKQTELDQKQASQSAAQEAGALAATQLGNQEKTLNQQSAMAKAVADSQITSARQAADQRIASLASEYARVVQTGNAEVAEAQAKEKAITDALVKELPQRLALIRSQAAAEAQGKTQPEQARIYAGVAGKETDAKGAAALEAFNAGQATAAAQNKSSLSLIDLNARLATELREGVVKGWDEVAKSAERAGEEQQRALLKEIALSLKQSEEAQRAAEGRAQISQAVGKGQGEVEAARVKATYEAQLSHSIQQQVAYEQTLASIQDSTYTKELTALAAKLKAAQALEDETEKAKQLLDIEAQIAAVSGKAQAAGVSAQGQIQKTQAQGFGQQIGQVGTSGLSSLSNALAEGVIRGGKGLGKDIRQSLQGIGKQLLGDAIKTSVEDLVIAMTGNTIATNLNTLWTELSTEVKGLFGFAGGTDSAPGGWSMVGEKGPEIMHVPRGAQIIPNHKISKYADGTPGYGSRMVSGGRSMTVTVNAHAHGVNNPEAFARQAVAAIPHELKRQSSSFSPYSS
jgi:hypothetical protein